MSYIPQPNLLQKHSPHSESNALNSLHPIAASLGLPLTQARLSKWVVQSSQSGTVSIGKFGLPVSLEISRFSMTVANPHTGKALDVSGIGAGVGAGEGLFPVSYTGSLPAPHLPDVYTRIVLGPASHDSMGSRLFEGVAMAFHLGFGAGVSLADGILLFLSALPPPPRTANTGVAQLDRLLSPDLVACVKAWTLATGLSYDVGISISASAILYGVTSAPHHDHSCPAIRGPVLRFNPVKLPGAAGSTPSLAFPGK